MVETRTFDPKQTYRSKGGFGLLPCHLDVQLLNKPSILLEVLTHSRRERLRSTADRLLRRLQEVRADRRIGERLADIGVEARDDLRRCSRRDEHTEPLVEHEPLDAASPNVGTSGRLSERAPVVWASSRKAPAL
jgi:hypothetical protein